MFKTSFLSHVVQRSQKAYGEGTKSHETPNEFVEMNRVNVERALQPANLSELELEATALQGKLLREGPGRTARLPAIASQALNERVRKGLVLSTLMYLFMSACVSARTGRRTTNWCCYLE